MLIHERLRKSDLFTYNLIVKEYGFNPDNMVRNNEPHLKRKQKKVELGDSAENLMKHSAYKRYKGAIRQIR